MVFLILAYCSTKSYANEKVPAITQCYSVGQKLLRCRDFDSFFLLQRLCEANFPGVFLFHDEKNKCIHIKGNKKIPSENSAVVLDGKCTDEHLKFLLTKWPEGELAFISFGFKNFIYRVI